MSGVKASSSAFCLLHLHVFWRQRHLKKNSFSPFLFEFSPCCSVLPSWCQQTSAEQAFNWFHSLLHILLQAKFGRLWVVSSEFLRSCFPFTNTICILWRQWVTPCTILWYVLLSSCLHTHEMPFFLCWKVLEICFMGQLLVCRSVRFYLRVFLTLSRIFFSSPQDRGYFPSALDGKKETFSVAALCSELICSELSYLCLERVLHLLSL